MNEIKYKEIIETLNKGKEELLQKKEEKPKEEEIINEKDKIIEELKQKNEQFH